MTITKGIGAVLYCRHAREPEIDSETNYKTALYCRTAQQDDFAIENQLNRLMSFASEKGYENLSAYIDNGGSGLTLNRPAMNILIEDINEGIVETVIVTSTCRIARDFAVMLDFMKVLNRANVPCVSLDCGGIEIKPEIDAAVGIMAALLGFAKQRQNPVFLKGV